MAAAPGSEPPAAWAAWAAVAFVVPERRLVEAREAAADPGLAQAGAEGRASSAPPFWVLAEAKLFSRERAAWAPVWRRLRGGSEREWRQRIIKGDRVGIRVPGSIEALIGVLAQLNRRFPSGVSSDSVSLFLERVHSAVNRLVGEVGVKHELDRLFGFALEHVDFDVDISY